MIPEFKMPEKMVVKHTHASIVLGTLSKVPSKTVSVVELGCGNGVVLILMAKLNPSVRHLIGIEINKNYCDFAKEVVNLNNFSDIIEIVNADAKDAGKVIGKEMADCVVFNPPFHTDGKISKKAERFFERNANSFELFVESAKELLKYGHKFFTIISPKNFLTDMSIFINHGMIPKNIIPVYGKRGVDSKLIFIEGIKGGKLGGFKMKAPLFLDEFEDR